ERRTLDGLLTLPGGRAAVLRAKWRGVLDRGRTVAAIAAVPLACGLAFGGFPPAVLVLCAAAQLAFCVSLGLYCSVRARTTTRACVGAGLGLLAVSVLPL